MIIPEHEIRESAIEGRGVFLKSNVKKGELLVIYTYGISELIHKEYHDQVCLDLENSPHRDVVDSSVRYVDNWFIFDSYSKHNLCFGSREGDFVNHSFEPAMIYHCGLCFAARDLKAGDELTVDYRYFMSEDLEGFCDRHTGRQIRGFSGREAFVRSLRQLNGIFSDEQVS